MKPKQMVRLAREAGVKDQDEGIRWIQRNHRYTIRPNLYALFSNQLDEELKVEIEANKAFTEVPTTVPAKEVARTLNQLVKLVGAEKVREMLDVVEELNR